MKKCPFCAEEVRDEAVKCRFCGEFLDGRARPAGSMTGISWGYEYRSKAEFLGLPLVHIAQGIAPHALGSNSVDPAMLEKLRHWLPHFGR